MLNIEHNHLAFSDDSNHKDGRFSSLCLLTFPLKFEKSLRIELEKIFKESGIEHELKWQNVCDAKHKFVVEKIYLYIFRNLDKLRLDILIWDMQDTRHAIPGRDDIKNIGRMYYHLVQNTLNKKWGEEASWFWQPDKQSGINWKELGDFLVSKKHNVFPNIFDIKEADFRKLKIKAIRPVNSDEEIFVQIADHFAGLGAYSYGHFSRYKEWNLSQNQCLPLWSKNNFKCSKTELVRFDLLSQLKNHCKNANLTVSLNSTNGLCTRNPSKQINFWYYKPQSILDKAPKK